MVTPLKHFQTKIGEPIRNLVTSCSGGGGRRPRGYYWVVVLMGVLLAQGVLAGSVLVGVVGQMVSCLVGHYLVSVCPAGSRQVSENQLWFGSALLFTRLFLYSKSVSKFDRVTLHFYFVRDVFNVSTIYRLLKVFKICLIACVSCIDVCVPNPCLNGAKCTEHKDPDYGRSPSCSCVDGWHGDMCDESKKYFERQNLKLISLIH